MELSDDPNIATVCLAHAQNNLDQFCSMIGEDGVMVLKLIAANSSDILVGQVVSNMWLLWMYRRNQYQEGRLLNVPETVVQPEAPQACGPSSYAGKMD